MPFGPASRSVAGVADADRVFFHPPDLPAALRTLLYQIPASRVTTYGTLAERLGDRVAARWIGEALLHEDFPADCPRWRVVRADGDVGRYAAGRERKVALLRREGIDFDEDGRLTHAAGALWDAFDWIPPPLAALRDWQRSLAPRVIRRDMLGADSVATIAGIDVAYPAAGRTARAAYALCDAARGALLAERVVRRPTAFPYITSYLTFREGPNLVDVIREAEADGPAADVLMVDGSGRLHPRGAGLATCVGVALGRPTIGVTKKRLCGDLAGDEPPPGAATPIAMDGEIAGYAIRPHTGGKRIYASPGNGVSLETCLKLTLRLMPARRRLPAPIHHADRRSRHNTAGA